jgi:hypothetical protein
MQALYDELRRSSASEVAAERDKLAAIIGGFHDGFCVETARGSADALLTLSNDILEFSGSFTFLISKEIQPRPGSTAPGAARRSPPPPAAGSAAPADRSGG